MQSSATDKDLIRIPVRLEMLDGTRMSANLISPRALLKLFDLINREEKFIDAELEGGERIIIAKSAIKTVKARDVPRARDLAELTEDKNGFDPYRVLHVDKSADTDAVRHAYLALVREYHPDRFASIDLPKEIGDYLSVMLRRVNAAYDMLSSAA
jgi:DnaJ-domain-containing protein 1